MSRPTYYWHGMVKRMIMRYPKLKEEKSIQSGIFVKAIEKAIRETEKLNNGDCRLKAVQMVCFDKTMTVDGVAEELHYSWRTVQNWMNDYIKRVGKNAGF